jgi:hypothetical protein
MTGNLTKRLAQVEKTLGEGPQRDVLIFRERGETTEQAIQRRLDARPDEADARFVVLHWGEPTDPPALRN